ncbi:MAG TPA: methyl-accepting chemotaxis protein [Rectinemataceae bacterium]|nr:methyl-accepting chemotaxis protein [Rectinemataceae bacterium]
MLPNDDEASPAAPLSRAAAVPRSRDRRKMVDVLPRATAAILAIVAVATLVAFAALSRNWIDRRAGEEAEEALSAAHAAFQERIADTVSAYLGARAEAVMDFATRPDLGPRGQTVGARLASSSRRLSADSAFAREVGETFALLDGHGRWVVAPQAKAKEGGDAEFARRVLAAGRGYLEFPSEARGGLLESAWIEQYAPGDLYVVVLADREPLFLHLAAAYSGASTVASTKGGGDSFLVDSDRRLVWGKDRFSLAGLATSASRRVEKNGRAFLLETAPLGNGPWIIVSATALEPYLRLSAALTVAAALALLLLGIGALVAQRLLLARAFGPIGGIDGIAKALSGGDLSPRIGAENDDEIGEFADLFDRVMDEFSALVTKMKSAIGSLAESIQNLSASTQQIASTSNEQAASVKEVLSTMEDSDRLSKAVEVKIDEVAKIANHTKDNVARGFELIQSSLGKMDEIRSTNSETLVGIKTLGDQIETIWDIVNIINDIADQTKIIAFNAELEAAAAGDAGKNFRIVAGEIRRLADGTVESTNEIKSKINEIQRASDKLILASERGTQRIREGWDVSTKIRGVFEDVLRSSEISASSANDISRSIRMQVLSFEQIFQTLKQISESIDSFVQSTSYTTEVSELLNSVSLSFRNQIAAYTLHRPVPESAEAPEGRGFVVGGP